jgi:hypothetical protein
VPLADAFNHKASVVALGDGYVVGEEADRRRREGEGESEEGEEEEDEEEEGEEEAEEEAGPPGGGGGFVGVGGHFKPLILSSAGGESVGQRLDQP